MANNNLSEKRKKSKLHPRNKHQGRYDLAVLCETLPQLKSFIITNPKGEESINFFNPEAVKILNKALLLQYYGLKYWNIPNGYLCPPIPGRVDYIHYAADLLAGQFDREKRRKTPKGPEIKCLDIGTGSNCIYPILGQQIYGWSFKASDIDAIALNNAQEIINQNPSLFVQLCRPKEGKILQGVIKSGEEYHLTICNPPFHSSKEEALKASRRKNKNLCGKKEKHSKLNFGGQSNELWIEGGELSFIKQMIDESLEFANQVEWFTTLVSRDSVLKSLIRYLKSRKGRNITVIPMGQGNKVSRVLAWKMR